MEGVTTIETAEFRELIEKKMSLLHKIEKLEEEVDFYQRNNEYYRDLCDELKSYKHFVDEFYLDEFDCYMNGGK